MHRIGLFSGIKDQASRRLEAAIQAEIRKSQPKSNSNKTKTTATPNLAKPPEQGSQFLSAINEVIGQLRAKKPVDPKTLGTLKSLCDNPSFDLRMNLAHYNLSSYDNLHDEEGLFETSTPLSLILKKLAIYTNNSDDLVISLLKGIPNLAGLLKHKVYNGTTSDARAIDIVHPNLIRLRNWLLENGAIHRKVNSELYSSDINIAKLRCILDVLECPIAPNYKEKKKALQSKFKQLFIDSLTSNERYNFKLNNKKKKFLDSTDDAVSLLFSGVHRLANEFILELFQIAKTQGYNFKAYGRDYGVGNLLYHCLRDVDHPPSIAIIKFLQEQGLNPQAEIARIPDDSNPDREVSCYKKEALKTIPTRDRNPKSPLLLLVEKHQATANGAQKGAWTKILNHLQAAS